MTRKQTYWENLQVMRTYTDEVNRGERSSDDPTYLAMKAWLNENFDPSYIGVLL